MLPGCAVPERRRQTVEIGVKRPRPRRYVAAVEEFVTDPTCDTERVVQVITKALIGADS